MNSLQNTMQKILAFRNKRDWSRFHTPRNLATALAIEAAEVQELMLWKTDEEVAAVLEKKEGKREIGAEIADVLIFTLLLCDTTGIDPISAINGKLTENRKKYPVKLAHGNATKYTRLRQNSRIPRK